MFVLKKDLFERQNYLKRHVVKVVRITTSQAFTKCSKDNAHFDSIREQWK